MVGNMCVWARTTFMREGAHRGESGMPCRSVTADMGIGRRIAPHLLPDRMLLCDLHRQLLRRAHLRLQLCCCQGAAATGGRALQRQAHAQVDGGQAGLAERVHTAPALHPSCTLHRPSCCVHPSREGL